jgi:hypothetical protein
MERGSGDVAFVRRRHRVAIVEGAVAADNMRGTWEQWINERKGAIKWRRL